MLVTVLLEVVDAVLENLASLVATAASGFQLVLLLHSRSPPPLSQVSVTAARVWPVKSETTAADAAATSAKRDCLRCIIILQDVVQATSEQGPFAKGLMRYL